MLQTYINPWLRKELTQALRSWGWRSAAPPGPFVLCHLWFRILLLFRGGGSELGSVWAVFLVWADGVEHGDGVLCCVLHTDHCCLGGATHWTWVTCSAAVVQTADLS